MKGTHSAFNFFVCAVACLSFYLQHCAARHGATGEPSKDEVHRACSILLIFFCFLGFSSMFYCLGDERAYLQVDGGSDCSILHQHHFAMPGGYCHSVLNIQQACDTSFTLRLQLLLCAPHPTSLRHICNFRIASVILCLTQGGVLLTSISMRAA